MSERGKIGPQPDEFPAGINWIEDWPVVVPDRFPVPPAHTSFVEEYTSPTLHPRWISPGPDPRTFIRPRTRTHDDEGSGGGSGGGGQDGGIVLSAGREPTAREARGLLAVRTQDPHWQTTATVSAGDVCLIVRFDDAHWAALERRGDVLSARVVVGPLDQTLATVTGIGTDQALAIRAVAYPETRTFPEGPDQLHLGHLEDGEFRALAAVDGRYLSTEVAGGFTGRAVGVEAPGADAVLTRFEYRALATATT
ncbi:hypothetical protein [Frankia sp. R82]|uniref:hypothetical protein n=1 Tax=Frankia sp. R82 TaxID=2950553 RepID=UPI002044AAF9|nr:hypothetical protein [Frankia sp. R82]MCM3882772.1 hypothetical protein [Frankia sp. R82]